MIYQTKVKKVGTEAEAFEEEKMIVLFGDNAPEELVDFCYIINIENVNSDVTEENRLMVDEDEFKITKVGSAVKKNLNDLGHITLKFDGSETAEQSGTLYLEDKKLPQINEGTEITIK
ncbi:PTS glucitol/sorbitol transporter subunit IIA [Salinicoccus albus]|uniref:PTS glucitol/sorbitol transporter subunit IIA n=1 Tax=Salinicoccus albus TaxID=418756 RepID=UPI00035F2685